jgi:hypothetical protein
VIDIINFFCKVCSSQLYLRKQPSGKLAAQIGHESVEAQFWFPSLLSPNMKLHQDT